MLYNFVFLPERLVHEREGTEALTSADMTTAGENTNR